MDRSALVNFNRKQGRLTGWQLKRYVPDLLEARIELLLQLRPDRIVDGGANRGQWSSEVRQWDRSTPIFAFEPVRDSFDALSKLSLENFIPYKKALSDQIGKAEIHVSGSLGMASSIGEPTDFYKQLYPGVTQARIEEIECVTLDSISEFQSGSTYLKLDLEGHEWSALQGATRMLEDPSQIVALEIETSISPTRDGEKVHYEIVPWLINTFGFSVYHLFTPAVSRAGRMNFVDCILTRG